MTLEPTLRCPCDGRFLEQAFHYEEPPEGETQFPLDGHEYVRDYDRCKACEHWFGRHKIPLERLYEDVYVDATYGDVDGMTARLDRILALPPEQSDNAQRVARVSAFADALPRSQSEPAESPERPRVLDVGAGIGVFPAAMLTLGWEVVAVEPDPRTVQMLSERLGIRAEAKDLLDLSRDDLGRFRAVTFNKVLEHVEDPARLLAHAAEFLSDDGFCYVEVPDVAAAQAGPEQEEFFIEHHHIFSPSSLALLGERSGLKVMRLERLVEPSGKFTVNAFFVR